MISPEKVIIIIALLFIICVMPFPIGLLMFKFKSEKLKAVGKYVFHGQYVAEILHAFFLVNYFFLTIGGIQFRFSDTDAELLLAVVTDKNE